jgi:hypothetical protein
LVFNNGEREELGGKESEDKVWLGDSSLERLSALVSSRLDLLFVRRVFIKGKREQKGFSHSNYQVKKRKKNLAIALI